MKLSSDTMLTCSDIDTPCFEWSVETAVQLNLQIVLVTKRCSTALFSKPSSHMHNLDKMTVEGIPGFQHGPLPGQHSTALCPTHSLTLCCLPGIPRDAPAHHAKHLSAESSTPQQALLTATKSMHRNECRHSGLALHDSQACMNL